MFYSFNTWDMLLNILIVLNNQFKNLTSIKRPGSDSAIDNNPY